MIAYSSDQGAQNAGESGSNMLTECCVYNEEGDEDCATWDHMNFPTTTCDVLGIAFAMPTCWNGGLGDDNGPEHNDHMSYTLDGRVDGECPAGYDRRLPQVQLFVRIMDYQGGKYIFSDGTSDVFHIDFFNGWEENKLQYVLDNCEVVGDGNPDNYNPPCNCDHLLTQNMDKSGVVCDSDIHKLIVNETIDVVVGRLPLGFCGGGADLIPKSWDLDPPLECFPVSMPPYIEDDGDELEDIHCEEECCFVDLQACAVVVDRICEELVSECEEECSNLDAADDGCLGQCEELGEKCFYQEEALCFPCERNNEEGSELGDGAGNGTGDGNRNGTEVSAGNWTDDSAGNGTDDDRSAASWIFTSWVLLAISVAAVPVTAL